MTPDIEIQTLEPAAVSASPFFEQWDALAAQLGRPRSAPAWVLAWYRHVLGDARSARILVATAGRDLVGVLPLWWSRDRLGLVRYDIAGRQTLVGVEPLATPELAGAAAGRLVAALARLRPAPDIISTECVSASDGWSASLQAGLRCPDQAMQVVRSTAPYLSLAEQDYARWQAGWTVSRRKQARRFVRRLTEAGFASHIWTDPADIVARLPELQRLVLARRHARGGWGTRLDAAVLEMMTEAIVWPDGTHRTVLATWERDGTLIAGDLGLVSGDVCSVWTGGVDVAYGRYSPGRMNLNALIEDCRRTGRTTVDLGPGEEPYKEQYSTGTRDLEHVDVTCRRIWPIHTPAQFLGRRGRHGLVEAYRSSRSALGRFGDRHA